ncbi:hypothetical protein FJ964_27950 [Mesorhizobium sp. B2-3-2]|nr:hypothetical protein FJ964_27950 [Mesorhizobium sp. B2-3-2]
MTTVRDGLFCSRGCRGWDEERFAPERPPLACRPSPPQGGRLFAPPLSPVSNVGSTGAAQGLPISPLEGEMPGRAEGGASR